MNTVLVTQIDMREMTRKMWQVYMNDIGDYISYQDFMNTLPREYSLKYLKLDGSMFNVPVSTILKLEADLDRLYEKWYPIVKEAFHYEFFEPKFVPTQGTPSTRDHNSFSILGHTEIQYEKYDLTQVLKNHLSYLSIEIKDDGFLVSLDKEGFEYKCVDIFNHIVRSPESFYVSEDMYLIRD